MVTQAGAEVIAVEKWDKRRLAYEVAGRREGIYILMYFSGETKAASELGRVMRISEDVIRHLIVRAEPGQAAAAKERLLKPAPKAVEEAQPAEAEAEVEQEAEEEIGPEEAEAGVEAEATEAPVEPAAEVEAPAEPAVEAVEDTEPAKAEVRSDVGEPEQKQAKEAPDETEEQSAQPVEEQKNE